MVTSYSRAATTAFSFEKGGCLDASTCVGSLLFHSLNSGKHVVDPLAKVVTSSARAYTSTVDEIPTMSAGGGRRCLCVAMVTRNKGGGSLKGWLP